jgi:CelD/BcsL family acetyltransferase involved in cellulose biosynthesis
MHLEADYERLLAAAGNTLPFATHDWHIAWCRHFLDVHGPMTTEPMIYVVRDAGGGTVAIVPMILTRRAIGPMIVGTLDLLGPDPAITEIRSALIQPAMEEPVARLVQAHLAARRDWDWIHWSGISGPFGDTLASCSVLRPQEPLIDYVIDLPDTWEALHAGLKRNIRESLRHCYNSLKRDGHVFTLEVRREPEAVRAGLERFFELHAMRAGLQDTVQHRDLFAGARVRRFLHDVCARLAQRDIVRIFELHIGGGAVASRLGFVLRGSLYLYYSGFDPNWRKYSVMTTTLAEAIKCAIAEKLVSVNLSTGTDVGKTRWGPRPVRYDSSVQIAQRLRSRLAYGLYRRAREAAHGAPWPARLLARGKRRWA